MSELFQMLPPCPEWLGEAICFGLAGLGGLICFGLVVVCCVGLLSAPKFKRG